MSSGRFRYLQLISKDFPSGSSKYQRTWEVSHVGVREWTSMQVHRMHMRHELQSVEHQIRHLQMFGLNSRIRS